MLHTAHQLAAMASIKQRGNFNLIIRNPSFKGYLSATTLYYEIVIYKTQANEDRINRNT